jgi:hypothetical protein
LPLFYDGIRLSRNLIRTLFFLIIFLQNIDKYHSFFSNIAKPG